MSGNSFGTLFKFSTFGESHGTAIGCVIDGTPPLIDLCEEDIQQYLDKRRPAQSRFTTQRQEPDKVKILSGVFEGKTTGTPIGLLIENVDHRSKDYGDIATKFRPGHADYTYHKKYGIRDYRGGGRSSARETAMRVAAGAVAIKVLNHILGKVEIKGSLVQMGTHKVDRNKCDMAEVNNNPFFCPDKDMAVNLEEYLTKTIIKEGVSVGAVVEVTAKNIPAGLGCPVYDKLDADIAKAMMSINAVKGVEIGAGFDVASFTGLENADEMIPSDNKDTPDFLSNNAGGILGGISSGQPITVRIAVKPTSSILIPRKSVDINGNAVEVMTKGRHDPCVGIRAVPVAEAMLACVLADHLLRHKAQCG